MQAATAVARGGPDSAPFSGLIRRTEIALASLPGREHCLASQFSGA